MPTEIWPTPQAASRKPSTRRRIALLCCPLLWLGLFLFLWYVPCCGRNTLRMRVHQWLTSRPRYDICFCQLGLYLTLYAEKYGGAFPAGAGSPEASLSLLWKEVGTGPQFLAGKAVSGAEAEKMLREKGYLDSAHCSIVYVEGLTENDPPNWLRAWDKFPGYGGHHYDHTFDERREALCVDGSNRVFETEAAFQEYLQRQQVELQKRRKR